jgi:hypothetical protein
MSKKPDFKRIDIFSPEESLSKTQPKAWQSPEGIAVKAAYGEDDLKKIRPICVDPTPACT